MEVYIEFIDNSLDAIKKAKNLAIKSQHYDVAAFFRGIEMNFINKSKELKEQKNGI